MSNNDEVDFSTLPLEQKLDNKVWKARLLGYEELTSKFDNKNIKIKEFNIYLKDVSLFQIYLSDPNVIALEKAIGALLSLLQKYYTGHTADVQKLISIESLIENWIPLLIEKGITSSRLLTKKNSIKCILLITSFDISIEKIMEFTIINFLKVKKLPKVILSSLITITNLINNFKFDHIELNKIFNNPNSFLIELLEVLPTFTSNADKNIRSQSIDLILQIYDKIGRNKLLIQDILLDKLKSIQQRDLDKLFDKLNSGEELKAISNSSANLDDEIIYFYTDYKNNVAKQDFQVDDDGDTNMDINATLNSAKNTKLGNSNNNNYNITKNKVDVDPFTLLKEETILDKLPENFNERIASVKWKDRVEVLQELHDNLLVKVKKLKNSGQDYSNLISILSSIIHKDANVQAVTIASQSICIILEKLRLPGFNKALVNICFVPLLERTKEKKPSVIEAIRSTLYILVKYYNPISNGSKSMNLNNEDMLQEILKFMKNKIPQIRFETTNLFNHILKHYFRNDSERILSAYLDSDILPIVIKIVNDTQPTIRASGFEAFALISKIFSNNDEIRDSYEKFDSMKKKKITELINTLPNILENIPESREKTGTTTSSSMNNSNSNSLLPSKRGPSSPLKKLSNKANSPLHMTQSPVIALPNITLKNGNLSNNNLNGNIPNNMNSNLFSINNKRSNTEDNQIENEEKRIKLEIEVENLKKEKHVWLKEKHELIDQLNNVQNKYNVLMNEIEVLKEQLKNSQTTLHDKNLQLRQKDLQLNKLQDRMSHMAELNGNTPTNRRSSLLAHSQAPSRTMSARPTLSSERSHINENHEHNNHTRKDSTSSEDLPHRVDLLKIDSNANVNDTFVNEESWKRAAEVTSQLKARIERMRAKTRE
ncbi:hypothetical protein TPHA_0H00930 [Tetrapisispora phaffii CBS 4417]|uniref:TOG domain-containing protein n=1 Tax=Tetrapisispora phaffii (strain ATCC 24235 / CBS 4417 / NBRC 1672 / NRRL Y-8282 / UCD 70-5) TaxID=1071381 RepID=G8BWZ7_TETPH|nr:hypothetical protein TPHA_0H00930 [Tetrapisispora phaffii CBS 4417]CCE64301.1 hypothetical protein TPHA_0H00930 [Tetrapisispora phaffii CBS 4417]